MRAPRVRYTIRVRFTVWRLMGSILCFAMGIGIVRFILEAEPQPQESRPVAQEEPKPIAKSGEPMQPSSGLALPKNSVGPERKPPSAK
jgi:hypothetical protein